MLIQKCTMKQQSNATDYKYLSQENQILLLQQSRQTVSRQYERTGRNSRREKTAFKNFLAQVLIDTSHTGLILFHLCHLFSQ